MDHATGIEAAIVDEIVGLRAAISKLRINQRMKALIDWVAFRHFNKVKAITTYALVAYNSPPNDKPADGAPRDLVLATWFGFRGYVFGYLFDTFLVKTAGGGEDMVVGYVYAPNPYNGIDLTEGL